MGQDLEHLRCYLHERKNRRLRIKRNMCVSAVPSCLLPAQSVGIEEKEKRAFRNVLSISVISDLRVFHCHEYLKTHFQESV